MKTWLSAKLSIAHFLSLSTLWCLAVPDAFGQVPVTNGLVAYYPFNGNVKDASGNGNDGAIVGSDWFFSFDRFSGSTNALYLNTTPLPPNLSLSNAGTTNNYDGTYVTVPMSAALDFNQDFTLSVWVNLPDVLPGIYPVHNFISNGSDQSGTNFRVVSNPNGPDAMFLQFGLSNTTNYFGLIVFVPPVRDAWWQAVVVRSGTTVSMFRNGVLLTNATMAGAVPLFPTIWFGRMQPPCACPYPYYSLVGGMDDVLMYNRALSTNEVQMLYQAPPRIVAQPFGQVGYWGFGASLSVRAEGSPPLNYQWFIDGFPISWGTNATLDFTNLDLSDAGTYEVEVTNLYGSVLSKSANLLVNPAGVSLGLYPGLTITGAVGKTFGIQDTTNLALSNGWATLSTLTLTQPAQLWFDTNANVSSGAYPQRLYRVVAVP